MSEARKEPRQLTRRALAKLDAVDRSLRWNPRATEFIVVVSLANAALYHGPLYSFAAANLDPSSFGGVLTLATLFFLLTFTTSSILALFSLLSTRWIKPFCMVAVMGNALAVYFVETYGVVLDKSMMGNVLGTQLSEASSFLHPRMLIHVLALGMAPCWLLSRVHVQTTSRLRRLRFLFVVLLIGMCGSYASSKTWLWIDQHARRLGGMTMPWSYLINASRHYADRLAGSPEPTLLPGASFASKRKTIVLLVIGESARAENFSLYGYARPTNPLLAQAGVVAMSRSRACSTYTTASVLCILSHVAPGRHAEEPLPSYLQRQGIDVIWRTNNWGEPPLRIQTFERAADLRRTCQGDSCSYDDILLHGLDQRIRSSSTQRIFVVLHQHGSHGPDYHTRYPKRLEAFTPVCESVELHRCTRQELVNAYDNSILYTDDFLYRAIGLLKGFPEAATLLMYISDHGESLGEHGLYLHGTPYSIAPDVQKEIPFLVWMSDVFQQEKGVGNARLAGQTSHSQANVFHSVMGAFDMRSAIYDRQLDIFGDEVR